MREGSGPCQNDSAQSSGCKKLAQTHTNFWAGGDVQWGAAFQKQKSPNAIDASDDLSGKILIYSPDASAGGVAPSAGAAAPSP